MSHTHTADDTAAENSVGAPNSTYVRTTIRIRNTYVRTYRSDAHAADFGGCVFAKSMHTLSAGMCFIRRCR